MTTLQADEPFLNYYQLDHDPFMARVPNFKFFSAQRKTILGQLHHLARHSQLMLVVTGKTGSGKTLLRQALIASVSKDTVKIINVSAADCSKVSDVFALLSEELQAPENTITAVIEQINKLSDKGITLYFMIDDADRLSEDVIQVLLNLAGEQLKGLRLFLFARPELLEQLEQSSLAKELTFNLPLTPYTLEETKEYLALRLEGAGQSLNLLSDEQVVSIYTQSGGWPGIINQVAKDLLIDSMQQKQTVESSLDIDPEPSFSLNFDEDDGKNDGLVAVKDGKSKETTTKPKLILPKKHLVIAGIIALGLIGVVLFSKSPSMSSDHNPSIVATHYEDVPDNNVQTTTHDIPLSASPEITTSTTNNVPAPAGDGPIPDTPVEVTLPVANNTTVPDATATNTVITTAETTPVQQPVVTTTPVTKPKQSETKAAVTAPTTPKVVAQGNAWYRNQVGSRFTIQVSVASTEKSAKEFIAKNSGSYRYFKRSRSNKVDYVVTLGEFTSRADAQAAIKKLPAAIQKSKPWARTFASIKQELAN